MHRARTVNMIDIAEAKANVVITIGCNCKKLM